MMPPTGVHGMNQRRKPSSTLEAPDPNPKRSADRAKALVVAGIGRLVDDGHASWGLSDSGDVELRLVTGEVFLLGGTTVTRIA
jgi:hypothetical protein